MIPVAQGSKQETEMSRLQPVRVSGPFPFFEGPKIETLFNGHHQQMDLSLGGGFSSDTCMWFWSPNSQALTSFFLGVPIL